MYWFRLPGVSAAIRDALPSTLTPVFHAVTLLGSPTVLMILLAVAFWTANRREWQYIIALAFTTLGILAVLKNGLGLPRPPAGVELITPSDPYGFPSGHATAATIVYGGAVYFVERFRTRVWGLIAIALVGFISLSRVALGVHYLGDVVAGIVLGALILATVPRLTDRNSQYAFALAFLLAIPAFLVAGGTTHILLDAGGALGGFVAATAVTDQPLPRTRVEHALLISAGLVLLVGVHEATTILTSPPSVFVADALLVCGILTAPTVLATLLDAKHRLVESV